VYLVFQLSVQFTLGSQEAQRFGFKPSLLTSLKSILIALLFPATLIPASLSGEKGELINFQFKRVYIPGIHRLTGHL